MLSRRGSIICMKAIAPYVLGILIGLGGYSAWAQVQWNDRETVQPINEPIVIRYRPFGTSVVLKTTRAKITNGTETFDLSMKYRGEMEAQRSGDGIRMSIRILEFESSKTSSQQSVPLPFEIFIDLSPRGKVRDIGIVEGHIDEAQVGPIKDLVRQMFPLYPEGGVRSGDTVMDTELAFGNMVSFRMFATAVGTTSYRNRPALVSDYNGNINLAGQNILIKGQALVDIATGAWVYSDMGFSGNVSVGGTSGVLSITEVGEIRLPRTIDGPARKGAPQAREAGNAEDRLTTLKKLLDQGLISEEEAAAKRKEILSGL